MGVAGAGKRVALVLALAALVALASQHAHVWTLPLRGWSSSRAAVLISVAVWFALGLTAAAAIATVTHSAWIARRPGAPPLRGTLLRALPIATAALAALSLLAIARTDPGPPVEPDEAGRPGAVRESSDRRGVPLSINWWTTNVRAGEGEPDPEQVGGAGSRSARSSPLLIAVAGVLTLLAGAAAWRSYRRRRGDRHALDHGARQEAVHGALVGTIDAMLADPDPNTAIRGAYARLLEGLDACGTGRRDHEAPMEHLHRVFTVLHVRPEPVRELIELFEVARFSTHPLSASHRDRALRALRDVAAELESDAAFRPGTAGTPGPAGPRPGPADAQPGPAGARPLTGLP